jgi:hypothetical protein
MKFCGEIAYDTNDGNVHSDICFNCNPKSDHIEITENYRALVHQCLDEWLNNSNGTGAFWLGNPDYFKEEK